MKKEIVSFIEDLKSNKKMASLDEASTKQAVVLRMLSFLGWDIFNVEEVFPNYSVDDLTVDYALRINNDNQVFIEVKGIQEELDNHQKNLLNFALLEGVELSVLTNGMIWWFYLSSTKGGWEQKRFHAINIMHDDPEEILPNLTDFLSRDNVSKGEFIKKARALHHSQKQKIAAESVPEAWNKMISEPNKIFVELLIETTEKLCGYKPESRVIEKFLKKRVNKWLIKDIPTTRNSSSPKEPKSTSTENNPAEKDSASSAKTKTAGTDTYTDKAISSFSFNGRTYDVRSWVELLTTLCNHFAEAHVKDFEKVLWISGNGKTYFSRYEDQLRFPEKIKKSDIFVETKLNADEIVETANNLLSEFGYDSEDLIITIE
ncbi:MAG: hypothetical protein JSW39_26765 [Desulfobacterales bacterium]|nr:MAG: hypothetical protein JSW39_26765 [Desulfobacterales bacterium]